jgi:hypothetical protein
VQKTKVFKYKGKVFKLLLARDALDTPPALSLSALDGLIAVSADAALHPFIDCAVGHSWTGAIPDHLLRPVQVRVSSLSADSLESFS